MWAFNRAYYLHGPLGHFAESIAELEQAERSDPLAVNVKWALIEMYLATGETAKAETTAVRMLKLNSTIPGAVAYAAYAYLANGDVQRASRLLEQLRATQGDDFWHVLMIEFRLDAATGRLNEARQLLARITARYAAGESVSPYVIGVGYQVLGDTRQAIDWWQRTVQQHHPHLGMMTLEFRADSVIGKDPRFLALLKRMGLEAEQKGRGRRGGSRTRCVFVLQVSASERR